MRAIQSVSRHARNRDPPHDGRSCLSPRLESETVLYSPLPHRHRRFATSPPGWAIPWWLRCPIAGRAHPETDWRTRYSASLAPDRPPQVRLVLYTPMPEQANQPHRAFFTSHPASSSRVHLGDPPRKTRYKGQIVPRTTEDYYSKGRADERSGPGVARVWRQRCPPVRPALMNSQSMAPFNKIERSVIVLI